MLRIFKSCKQLAVEEALKFRQSIKEDFSQEMLDKHWAAFIEKQPKCHEFYSEFLVAFWSSMIIELEDNEDT